jgi:hypothetical protein
MKDPIQRIKALGERQGLTWEEANDLMLRIDSLFSAACRIDVNKAVLAYRTAINRLSGIRNRTWEKNRRK